MAFSAPVSFATIDIVIVGIGIGDAAAARRHAVNAAFVERLQKREKRARPGYLLRFNQLLTAPNLAGGNVVLHIRHHHRDDRERLRDAGDLGNHPDLHDLRLDLAETRGKKRPTCLRDQYAGWTHHRIDEVADTQHELLDAPIHAGADHGLVEIDLCLREGCLGAGLLGRQQCR